jgi:GDP-4-dehydro-6-deoxy-D-mannose reductase
MIPRCILVTGAAGFVGRHLLPILRNAFPDAKLVKSNFDITDAEAVQDGIAAVKPDALVHLAAIAAPPQARQAPNHAWQVNLHGTLNVARGILAVASDCTMLFASSAEAYGASFGPGLPLDEMAALAPLNTYGATKAAADLALRAMAEDGLKVVRARPFNHTGRGQTAEYVVAAFARQVARIEAGQQEPVLRVGALDPLRDFLDVRDVCAAYTAILANMSLLAPHAIVNIASGRPRRIGDILDALMKAADITPEVQADPGRLRPTDLPITCGDASVAHQILGWTPAIPWEQTLADVLTDWRERIFAPDSA